MSVASSLAPFARGSLPTMGLPLIVDECYAPQHERGIRWNDPRFEMRWPAQPAVISEKDRSYRDFNPAWYITA